MNNNTDNIQWFPGHMTKTKRLIAENIKLVDAVAEIVDARIPEASRNPILDDLLQNKPRIIILNKSDYADKSTTALWCAAYQKKGYSVLVCDCKSGRGVSNFPNLLKTTLSDVLQKRIAKGVIGRALRVMVVGIPNVGKSSFINRVSNSKRAKVEDRPGVTRGKQWVSVDNTIEILDTPGILWPKFDDQAIAIKLAITGAIKDDIMDTEKLAGKLLNFLIKRYPENLKERYKLTDLEGNTMEKMAVSRGMLLKGGVPDVEKISINLLDEFRSGKLGKISLEKPVSV